ncbi:unnamed protein product [Adineta steineri]|uniref:F-box domain-containing protein n=1 Tax=Adineta steineri TaxID=433720 RepID=A0A819YXJ1_9BILA|nr:unnamed protein product [Adineta steineri]
MISCFEDLPNELLYDLLSYMDIRQIHRSFFGLNHRWNALINSLKDIYFVTNGSNDVLDDISAYVSRITHVRIRQECFNLSFYPFRKTVHSMSADWLCGAQVQELQQLVHLTRLKINFVNMANMLDFSLSIWQRLQCESKAWSALPDLLPESFPHLSSLSIPVCLRDDFYRILISAPNLVRLHMKIFRKKSFTSFQNLSYISTLRRLDVEWYIGVNYSDWDFFLSQVPFLETLHLSIKFCIMPSTESLYELLHQLNLSVQQRLFSLHRFSSSIKIHLTSPDLFDRSHLDLIFARGIRIEQSGHHLHISNQWTIVK